MHKVHSALDKNPDQVPAQELPSRAASSVCDTSPYPTVQPLEEGREGEDPQEKKILFNLVVTSQTIDRFENYFFFNKYFSTKLTQSYHLTIT